MLPVVQFKRAVFNMDGQEIQCRSLSRSEVMEIKSLDLSVGEMEARIISYSTDTPLEDVKAWLDTIPAGMVDPLTVFISELSGLIEGAQKSS